MKYDWCAWKSIGGDAIITPVILPSRKLIRKSSEYSIGVSKQIEPRRSVPIRNYDILVIALGSVTTVPHVPGVREHVQIFRRPPDAVQTAKLSH